MGTFKDRINAMRSPSFIHGTSGWSHKDWVGPFYPPGKPEWKFLEFYATRFPGLEVDSTFYRTPYAKTIEAWNRAGFLFPPKMVQEVILPSRVAFSPSVSKTWQPVLLDPRTS